MELEYDGIDMHVLTLNDVERVNVYTDDMTTVLWVRWAISATCLYAPYEHGTGLPPPLKSLAYAYEQVNEMSGRRGTGVTRGTAVTPENNPPLVNAVGRFQQRMENYANKVAQLFTFRRAQVPAIPPAPKTPSFPTLREDGTSAAVYTDAMVWRRLSQPRKKLRLYTYPKGDNERFVWLESPPGDLKCDAHNGPIPTVQSVKEINGLGRSFIVHLGIETYVPACPDDKLILAHRFSMSHAADDDTYQVRRITQGEVHFNTGELYRLGHTPDAYRRNFMHPIPYGFRRSGPQVSLSSDNSILSYTLVDVDQNVIMRDHGSGATSMDVKERFFYHSPVLRTQLSKYLDI